MYSAHHFSLYEVSYDIILCLFLDLFIKRDEESHKSSELWKTSKVSIVLELVYKTCVIFRQSTKLLRGKNIILSTLAIISQTPQITSRHRNIVCSSINIIKVFISIHACSFILFIKLFTGRNWRDLLPQQKLIHWYPRQLQTGDTNLPPRPHQAVPQWWALPLHPLLLPLLLPAQEDHPRPLRPHPLPLPHQEGRGLELPCWGTSALEWSWRKPSLTTEVPPKFEGRIQNKSVLCGEQKGMHMYSYICILSSQDSTYSSEEDRTFWRWFALMLYLLIEPNSSHWFECGLFFKGKCSSINSYQSGKWIIVYEILHDIYLLMHYIFLYVRRFYLIYIHVCIQCPIFLGIKVNAVLAVIKSVWCFT